MMIPMNYAPITLEEIEKEWTFYKAQYPDTNPENAYIAGCNRGVDLRDRRVMPPINPHDFMTTERVDAAYRASNLQMAEGAHRLDCFTAGYLAALQAVLVEQRTYVAPEKDELEKPLGGHVTSSKDAVDRAVDAMMEAGEKFDEALREAMATHVPKFLGIDYANEPDVTEYHSTTHEGVKLNPVDGEDITEKLQEAIDLTNTVSHEDAKARARADHARGYSKIANRIEDDDIAGEVDELEREHRNAKAAVSAAMSELDTAFLKSREPTIENRLRALENRLQVLEQSGRRGYTK